MKLLRTLLKFTLYAVLLAVAVPAAAGEATAAENPSAESRIALSVSKAVRFGLKSSEQLRQAKQDIQKARAGVTEAKAAAFPKLNLVGQYSRNIKKPVLFLPPEFGQAFGMTSSFVEIGEDNDFMGRAVIDMPLWTVGRLGAAINIARDYLSAFSDRETAARNYAVFMVKEAYYRALLASKNLEIAEQAMEATRESARIARAGHKEGTVSRFDLLRAEVELSNRRAPLVRAENDLHSSYILLRRRCGLEPDTQIELTDTLSTVDPPAEPEELLSRMKAENPELNALQSRINLQREYLTLQKAERYPIFNLTAYYAMQTQWSNDYLPEDNTIARTAAVQIGVQVPIFDGFAAKGRIRQARADLRMANIELEKGLRDKELAVRTARLSLINALTALEGRREAVELAEEAHRIALVKMENGLATPLERLDAELAMTTARAQLAEALYSCNMARARLELAIGTDTAGKYRSQ